VVFNNLFGLAPFHILCHPNSPGLSHNLAVRIPLKHKGQDHFPISDRVLPGLGN